MKGNAYEQMFINNKADKSRRDYSRGHHAPFTGVIDSKKWGKKCNLLVYVTLDNDEKIFASVWAYNPSKVEYLDMDKVPVGSKVALTFVKGKSGVPYLREFEVLSTPGDYENGDDNDDY